MTFRIRLKVRFAKALTTGDIDQAFHFAGREVRLRASPPPSTPWAIFEARGFADETRATAYGEQLRHALVIAAVSAQFGVDDGDDKNLMSIRDFQSKTTGLNIIGDVHGLMVIDEDKRIQVVEGHAEGYVLANLEAALSAITGLEETPPLPLTTRNALRVMNIAMVSQHDVAKIALALSAVEGLGQTEQWSDGQTRLLQSLAASALTLEPGPPHDEISHEERLEVSNAMSSVFKISLRQGVMRVLKRIELFHLKREWDNLYRERSALLHGTKQFDDATIASLADRTMSLCSTIVLRLAQRDGVTLPDIALAHFPALSAPPTTAAT